MKSLNDDKEVFGRRNNESLVVSLGIYLLTKVKTKLIVKTSSNFRIKLKDHPKENQT
jgi:hypothetical protein